MGLPLKKYSVHYTISDWEQWQDRWELIDGLPYSMSPAPTLNHQNVNGAIYAQLREKLSTCDNCSAFLPIDWQINDDTVVQPDVSVVCQKVTGKRLFIPPTVVFEVLSPSTKDKDQNEKFDLYQASKVKYYIMVDPDNRSFEIFKKEKGIFQKQFASSIFEFDLDECKVNFDFSMIWD
jgi:Uma2 family endonuclease